MLSFQPSYLHVQYLVAILYTLSFVECFVFLIVAVNETKVVLIWIKVVFIKVL